MIKNTWTKEMSYAYDSENRIEKMLLLSDAASKRIIFDVGCGKQQAKSIIQKINPAIKYIGCDLHAHCPDTMHCDFNNGIYPDFVDLPAQDGRLALLAGIMEYIHPKNIKRFISFIASHSDSVVVSYTHSDISGISSKIWINDLSQIDIMRLFRREKFRLMAECMLTARDGTLMHNGSICLYYFNKLNKWHRRSDS